MRQYERKIPKIGNSYGVTLPVHLLKQVGLQQGDHLQVDVQDGQLVLRKKEDLILPDGVDAEFLDILNGVIKEHDQAFKGLVYR